MVFGLVLSFLMVFGLVCSMVFSFWCRVPDTNRLCCVGQSKQLNNQTEQQLKIWFMCKYICTTMCTCALYVKKPTTVTGLTGLGVST
jgi:hypothetical protein